MPDKDALPEPNENAQEQTGGLDELFLKAISRPIAPYLEKVLNEYLTDTSAKRAREKISKHSDIAVQKMADAVSLTPDELLELDKKIPDLDFTKAIEREEAIPLIRLELEKIGATNMPVILFRFREHPRRKTVAISLGMAVAFDIVSKHPVAGISPIRKREDLCVALGKLLAKTWLGGKTE